MKEVQNNRKKRFRPFQLIRLLGIALFIYILTTIDISGLWDHLKQVQTNYLLWGIFFQFILLIFKAFRWHILNCGGRELNKFIRSFGEFFESYAIGVITPGRMGELVKAGHASGKNRIMETGIRMVAERGFDLGMFVLVAGLGTLLAFEGSAAVWIGILVLLGAGMILALAIIFMRSARATVMVEKVLNRLPLLKLNLSLSFRKRSNLVFFAVIMLSIAGSLSHFISCYLLARGLFFEQSFLYISGVVAIAGLLNMLPVTVMGLGTREGTFLMLFRPMADSLILAFSGLVFLVAQVGGGLVSLILGQLFLSMSKKTDSEDQGSE